MVGCSAYFDVSVCSTTRISSSASCAGLATAAGEVAKDEKHLAAVEKVETDFCSFCSFSVRMLDFFCLKILKTVSPPGVV